MTLIELSKLMSSKDLHQIQIEAFSQRREDLVFIGSLYEYLDAVKILGGRAIFVSTISMSDEHLIYTPKQTSSSVTNWPFPTHFHEADEDSEIYEYDLCSVKPELEEYKKRIGENGYFELSGCNLTYSIYEPWMQEMEVLRAEAQEIIDEEILGEEGERLALQEEQDAEEQVKLDEAVKKLKALISDRNFVRLSTQMAMRAYAIDKIPELENLDEAELKREIQNLGAKIQARGLK